MRINVGDIVLVPFPFTDFSSAKVRPALVILSGNNFKDVIILAITSKSRGFDEIILDNDALSIGKLPVKSFIRYDKVTSIDRVLVRKNVGSLKKVYLKKVLASFKKQF